MPVKIGAGGKLQNYDSKGRYCKTHYFEMSKKTLTRKEKNMIKKTY